MEITKTVTGLSGLGRGGFFCWTWAVAHRKKNHTNPPSRLLVRLQSFSNGIQNIWARLPGNLVIIWYVVPFKEVFDRS